MLRAGAMESVGLKTITARHLGELAPHITSNTYMTLYMCDMALYDDMFDIHVIVKLLCIRLLVVVTVPSS